MNIGNRLRSARMAAGLTQEEVAHMIRVSRQTISNWENERTYPDIISLIDLSDIYGFSLDAMLKGDADMLKHLAESTNIVKSNKKLIIAFVVNAMVMVLLAVLGNIFSDTLYIWIGALILLIISTTVLVGQLVRRF